LVSVVVFILLLEMPTHMQLANNPLRFSFMF